MDIDADDVRAIHTAITNRGSPIKANRTVKLLSKIMNLCEEWGYRQRDTNPCKWVAHNPENERDRYLDCHENSFSKSAGKSDKEKESELTIFLTTITEAVADGTIHINYGRIYLLLLLTGARLSEITHLQKKEIEFDKSRIVKEDFKTRTTQRKKKKLRIIMLNGPATEIIKEALAETAKDFEYVFESHPNPGFPYVNINKGWYH
jgi:integrase